MPYEDEYSQEVPYEEWDEERGFRPITTNEFLGYL